MEIFGGVAQLARASALHAEGRGFESLRLHHSNFVIFTKLLTLITRSNNNIF